MPAALSALLDALYPPRCLVCTQALPSMQPSLCSRHGFDPLEQGPVCPRCAAPKSPHLPAAVACAACRKKPPRFQRTLKLGGYHSAAPLRDWILGLKHGGRRDLAAPLGAALGRLLEAEPQEWRDSALLVPVPLHPLRRLERGYDQALLLARAVAREQGLPCLAALKRQRHTVPQGSPGPGSRLANVQGAFGLRRRARVLRDRPVWLVDDVLTTGATASECARVLMRGGAARVGLLVVARASRRV
ncbi:MAG TPA: ComF family protein [Planctomycetes bacterium]|jgi:ComF family protein|nr:ComF family protein [Planctomycetota bacterium]